MSAASGAILQDMIRTCLVLFIAMAPISFAHAGDTGAASPGALRAKATASRPEAAAPRAKSVNPCSEFGPGFVQIEGSTTCARIGGAIGIGATTGVNR